MAGRLWQNWEVRRQWDASHVDIYVWVVLRQLVLWIFLLNIFHFFCLFSETKSLWWFDAYHSFCRVCHLLHRTRGQRNSLQVQIQLSVQELSFQDRFAANLQFSSAVLQAQKAKKAAFFWGALRVPPSLLGHGLRRVLCRTCPLCSPAARCGRRRGRATAQWPATSCCPGSFWSAKIIYHRVESKQK